MRPAGNIALRCDAEGGRSRLRSIRCEGLCRSSRAFALPAGALRLVFSMLGPGVLGGDRFTFEGTLAAGAALVAAGQMATPVFAGAEPSASATAWRVADGATLLVAGEPLLLEAGSRHAAQAALTIEGSGRAIVVDTFSLRGPAALSMRTQALLDGALVYRDAYDAGGDEAGAFGSVAFIAADPAARAAFAVRAGAVAATCSGVRVGSGETAAAVVLRLMGERVWDVRAAAFAIAGVTEP